MLRSIAREPRIGMYSMAAFNLDQREVIYRQREKPEVDFPALGAAIHRLQLGTVTVDGLKKRPDQFLSGLLAEELQGNPFDAVIFIGPRNIPDVSFLFTVSQLIRRLQKVPRRLDVRRLRLRF